MIPRGHWIARRLRLWSPVALWIFLFGYAVWPWMPWKKPASHTVIVFYGFSILGEVLNQTILPAFQQYWKHKTGEHLEFATSFAGSGTVTNQLIMGVPAQLALLSAQLDAERLAGAGLIRPESWRRFPYGGIVNRTPFVILVRSGNPKRIHSLSDLTLPGIRVVHPDPLTSGAANWAVIAEYGAGIRQDPAKSHDGGYAMLLGLWRNVVAQAPSARAARTQFENGFGDALITYEQEALWDRVRGKQNSEIVYPRCTILSEHVLVRIDRNISPEQQEAVNAFIDFLWSEKAQRLFVRAGFRSVDEDLNTLNPRFGKIADPFLIDALGGWEKAKPEIVDSVWRNRVLKQLGKQP